MVKLSAREVAYSAAMAALIYVGTSVAIPMPRPLGIWHFGDIITFIVCILFGPVVGGLSSAIGPTLFDLWNPLYGSQYVYYAPATLVIRGCMGVLLGSIRALARKNVRLWEPIAMAIVVTEKNLGYFAYDLSLFGLGPALFDLTFFPMDAIFIIVTLPILYALRKRLGKMYIIPPKKPEG
jgi:uncharacterized membrane protein